MYPECLQDNGVLHDTQANRPFRKPIIPLRMSQTMVKLEREGERERGMGEGGEREGRREEGMEGETETERDKKTET